MTGRAPTGRVDPVRTDFVALIPARLASSRLPGKPLADLAGKPMVVRVAERAAASGARLVAVATDAAEVAEVVERHGFRAVMTRADHASGTDRLAEAAETLGLDDDEIVANVQGDEPLMPPALVGSVAALLAGRRDCAIATASHPVRDVTDLLNPNVVKVVTDSGGRAMYFSRAPIPFARDALAGFPSTLPAALPRVLDGGAVQRHVGLYAYRVSFLRAYRSLAPAPLESIEALEQLRALWHGHSIAVLRVEQAPPAGVDTPADLERVRRCFEAGGGVAPN